MIDIENDDKNKQSSRVKVAIRVRPMIQKQITLRQNSCFDYQQPNTLTIGREKCFTFDRVFVENSTQQEVYDGCVKELVRGCFEGYNAAILAYGQTGSGKTYTMGTNTINLEDIDEIGIIPRVVDQFFNEVQKRKEEVEFTIKSSFIEIYNEQIIDLLSNDHIKGHKQIKMKDNFINIRDEKDGSVSVCGVHEVRVTTPDQMINLISKGALNRSTSSTLMNDSSSRSHGIFTIFLQQHPINQEDENGFITAKFYFADLAGSERVKKTGATGVAFREGVHINMGLFELGNVISALSTTNKRQNQLFSYRNSKLTRILQDCLGGNSNTYMIACVSPAEYNYEESLSTLNYASKAMSIKNKPIINRDPHSAQINSLKQRIIEVESDNKNLRIALENAGIKTYQRQQDFRRDLLNDQLQRLGGLVSEKQKEKQKLQEELKSIKKKVNQVQITNYDLRRKNDTLACQLEEIYEQNPTMHTKQPPKEIKMVDKYLTKITSLQTELFEQEKLTMKLQNEVESLQKELEKEEALHLSKNKQIAQLKDQQRQLNKVLKQYEMERSLANRKDPEEEHSDKEQEISYIQISSDDEEIVEREDDLKLSSYKHQGELRQVSYILQDRQNQLLQITDNKINLEYQLISQMKEQYEQKIIALEKKKEEMLKQHNQKQGFEKNPKLKQKIEQMESELKELRKKEKDQKNLQKKLKQQNQKISNLTSEIQNCKVQKIELNKRIRADKKAFNEFKNQKMKDLMKQKKENMRKDGQIRKLSLDNKKKTQAIARTREEIKRVKKAKQFAKAIENDKKRLKASRNKPAQNGMHEEISHKKIDKIISQYMEVAALEVQKKIQRKKYQGKVRQMEEELDKLYAEEAEIELEKDRKAYQGNSDEEDEIKIESIRERTSNLQESIKLYESKLQKLQPSSYDINVEIIYNKNFDDLQTMRYICKSFHEKIQKILDKYLPVQQEKEELENDCNWLRQQNEECKAFNRKIAEEHNYNLARLREQMLEQQLKQQEQLIDLSTNRTCKCGDREKRNMERKINELQKRNRQLQNSEDMWRRKYSMMQDKYHQNKTAKDKFIGLPLRDQIKNPTKIQVMMEEVSVLQAKYDKTNRKNEDEERLVDGEQLNVQYNKNQWKCIGNLQAHGTPVLSVASLDNIIATSATKSLKIWDLQKSELIADLSNQTLQGFVKCAYIDQQHEIILCACQKQIFMYDLRTFEQVAILKAHQNEIRSLHIDDNYLFSCGKGSINNGGIFKWDLRGQTCYQIEERQKNLDIFAMTSFDRILYYGTRSHQVRRMNIDTSEILGAFEPPHLDIVTSLAILNGHLISGAKDKYLKLWSLQSCTNSSSVHAFNDHINHLTADPNLSIFYAGGREGTMKVGRIEGEKIRLIGGMLAHTQSVNSLCTIKENGLVSGSTDKTVKIWKPTSQTLDYLRGHSQF